MGARGNIKQFAWVLGYAQFRIYSTQFLKGTNMTSIKIGDQSVHLTICFTSISTTTKRMGRRLGQRW
jgi:hypothetical protein